MTLGAQRAYTSPRVAIADGRNLWDGARLRELREARGLTQGDLGGAAGIGAAEISRHERNDESSNPTIAVLARLARALSMPLAVLFEPVGSAIPRPEESGHYEDRQRRQDQGNQFLATILAHVDEETPAEDTVRGDILKAVAVLNRALRRPSNTGEPPAPAAKAGR